MDRRAVKDLLLLGLIWGASFLFIKIGVTTIDAFSFAAARVTIGAATLWLFWRRGRAAFPHDPRSLATFAVLGLIGIALPFVASTWGTQFIPSGLSAILNATMPLFTVTLAAASGAERLTGRRAAGVGCGFAGIAVLSWHKLVGPATDAGLWGEAALVAAAVFSAAGIVYARHRAHGFSPLATSTGQLTAGALWLLPLWLAQRPWAGLAAFLAVGLGGAGHRRVGNRRGLYPLLPIAGRLGRRRRLTGHFSGAGVRHLLGWGGPRRAPALAGFCRPGCHRRRAGPGERPQGHTRRTAWPGRTGARRRRDRRSGGNVMTTSSEPRTVGALLRRIGELWLIYIKGQFLAALIVGAIIWVVSAAIGLSWAPLMGLLAGLLQTVPGVGAVLAIVPAAIVALWRGSSVIAVEPWVFMLIVIAAYLVVQQISNLIIEPRLTGSRLRLPPLVVLLAVVVGAVVGNVIGAYLAVPLLVTAREIVRFVRRRPDAEAADELGGTPTDHPA